jgi:hypothetical protein
MEIDCSIRFAVTFFDAITGFLSQKGYGPEEDPLPLLGRRWLRAYRRRCSFGNQMLRDTERFRAMYN